MVSHTARTFTRRQGLEGRTLVPERRPDDGIRVIKQAPTWMKYLFARANPYFLRNASRPSLSNSWSARMTECLDNSVSAATGSSSLSVGVDAMLVNVSLLCTSRASRLKDC